MAIPIKSRTNKIEKGNEKGETYGMKGERSHSYCGTIISKSLRQIPARFSAGALLRFFQE